MMQAARPVRQDTLDLRDQIYTDDYVRIQSHTEVTDYNGTDDEEHSIIEDESDGEDRDADYMDDDDDGSSSLSIPNESIDFDLVYSLHSFAATVEGQANVVKGDSLFLMDDSNSYWWLVRVLKTQEVGYIPAENIETPFERLARLNKHRNIDLASATQAELQEDVHASRERLRNNISSRNGSNGSPSPGARANGTTKGVAFKPALFVHRYPPAVWNEDEEEDEDVEWDDGAYEDEDMDLAQEQIQQSREGGVVEMEPDDGMGWDDSVAQEMQARQAAGRQPQQIQIGGFSDGSVNQDQQLQLQQQQIQAQRQQEYQQQQLLVQQQQQQAAAAAAAAAAAQQSPQQSLRGQGSRERLKSVLDTVSSEAPNRIDPLASSGTRRVTVTPTIARDPTSGDEQESKAPILPSNVLQKQDEERKRTREEIEALEESEKKRANKGKMPGPVSSSTLVKANPNGKLRKEQPEEEPNKEKEKKKKSGGMFSSLFGRRKDKSKEKDKQGSSTASVDSGSLNEGSRGSEEDSLRSASRPSLTTPEISPTTATAIQQQQHIRNTSDPKRATLQSAAPLPQVSQLRQRDQHQQALYQQYLNRSPSSPPEAQANYGLQTAAVVTGSSSLNTSASSASGLGLGPPTPRQRPGSLILTSSSLDGQGVGVPELSVIRVFAGKNLQTEATFKTVLLNSLTTSSDLVKQALQRFRLPTAEDEKDYYLTVKQVEGSSAVLLPTEHPLKVFEMLVEAAELPKVKRSSVGSISSLASNLSMHPAIKKLSMNDFTDDSAVKIYLNRRGDDGVDDSVSSHDGDDTIVADLSQSESERSLHLSVAAASAAVASERFNSPSFRFALQLAIYPDDLPDDMVFDPMTEAIVFKHTLRDRSTHSMSSGVSLNMRRKVFMFPKNVTVAEVIEIGLERFGILEGVVDGGDEVEDKLTKRRSMARVRYGLVIDTGSQERELAPSSKVIDAFPVPPTYRAVDRATADRKRRSVDSTQLLGSMDDVSPDDPIFILRRAVSYRNSTSRHRMSVPLDEIALQHLHRESASSVGTDAQTEEIKHRQQSRQEIIAAIAAQREATRANQRAILSAQMNSVRGVDVVLAGNVVLRSSRYEVDEKTRYSYVQPDGETYDISDIVEEEWRESGADKNDLLEGVMAQNKDEIGDKIDRVLNKIRSGKAGSQSAVRALSPLSNLSESAVNGGEASGSRAPTPGRTTPTPHNTYASATPSQSRSQSPYVMDPKDTRTPPSRATYSATSRRQPSIASVMSDLSTYATPEVAPTPSGSPREMTGSRTKVPILPKEDFGISHMMAIIEYRGSAPKTVLPRLHPVEEMLYGRPVDIDSLHEDVRKMYMDSFKRLEDMDKALDEFVKTTIGDF